MTEWSEVSANRCYAGTQYVYKFKSAELKSTTKIGVYLPDAKEGEKLPLLVYLSGLTCTEQNFITKAGAQRVASKQRVIVVNPDTSPRDLGVEGEKESYEFGEGASFYVDATEPKWATNYRMYSYIVNELLPLVTDKFPIDANKRSIFGHSMGGHALFCSISSFAGNCHPLVSKWGAKALRGYLGDNKDAWKKYDATELAQAYAGPARRILLDQGTDDEFYTKGELNPEHLADVKNAKLSIELRKRDKYDHGYYYIATFLEEHFNFHANIWTEQSN